MVAATLRGYVTLWDLRFRIPVYTWQYPQENPAVYALSLCGAAPTVLMATNNNEVYRAHGFTASASARRRGNGGQGGRALIFIPAGGGGLPPEPPPPPLLKQGPGAGLS